MTTNNAEIHLSPSTPESTTNENPSMITPSQAAQKLGVSPALIYQWCKEGQIEHYRFGGKGKRGKLMIEIAAFERFKAHCRQATKPLGLKHIQLKPR